MSALEDVYRQHHAFVWRSLLRLGVPEPAVDDAVHDVFVVAARRLDEFEGRAAITSWLFAVAIRVAQHHHRATARRLRRERALADAAAAAAPSRDSFARSDAARTLHELLQELEPDRRHVFILMELEQMSGREVAQMLGLKTATVHSRLRLARQQLREAAERRQSANLRRSA